MAIKIVLANARGSNIEREIQILRKTRHKNIARLYEVITTPQRTFLIEEVNDQFKAKI